MSGAQDDSLSRTRHQFSDWLLAEGWKLKDIAAPAGHSGWALEGTDSRGQVVIFSQDAKRPAALIMHAPITIDESSRARLEALGSERVEELAWEIRFQLLDMGLKFVGLAVPLERFRLILRVYTDDLGRNGFFDRLDRLQNGIFAAVWLIRRALSEPASDGDGTDAMKVN